MFIFLMNSLNIKLGTFTIQLMVINCELIDLKITLRWKHTFDFCLNDLLENSRICWKHWAFWTKYWGSSNGDIELKNINQNIQFINKSN